MTDEDLTALREALTSARRTMAFSSQDWGSARDFAWLYGILVGWSDDEYDAHHQIAQRFGWSDGDVEKLRRLRAAVEAFERDGAAR